MPNELYSVDLFDSVYTPSNEIIPLNYKNRIVIQEILDMTERFKSKFVQIKKNDVFFTEDGYKTMQMLVELTDEIHDTFEYLNMNRVCSDYNPLEEFEDEEVLTKQPPHNYTPKRPILKLINFSKKEEDNKFPYVTEGGAKIFPLNAYEERTSSTTGNPVIFKMPKKATLEDFYHKNNPKN